MKSKIIILLLLLQGIGIFCVGTHWILSTKRPPREEALPMSVWKERWSESEKKMVEEAFRENTEYHRKYAKQDAKDEILNKIGPLTVAAGICISTSSCILLLLKRNEKHGA